MKPVLIKWIDAQTLNPNLGLIGVEDLQDEKPVMANSIGFLVAENKECYVIADEAWDGFGEVKYVHVIPKCSVKSVVVLNGDGTPELKAESETKTEKSLVNQNSSVVESEATETKVKNAMFTPIVGRTSNLSIRQGPLDDILKLETVTFRTILPVLYMWHPRVKDKTIEDNYVWIYLRFLRNEKYIDEEGHVLKKPNKPPETKKNPSAALPVQAQKVEKPITPELKKELETATNKPAGESTEVGRPMYDERTKGDDVGASDAKPDLIHPIEKDLTVVMVKGKVEIYLEPLNELLKFERIDDTTLQRVLVKYYDVPRVSFMAAIRETWMDFLKDDDYIDKLGKPTCKEAEL